MEGVKNMNNDELINITIDDFSEIQDYISLVEDENSLIYKALLKKYNVLKAKLTVFGVNLVKIDIINK